MTLQITDKDFENTVLNAKGLVLVDFWAEWCGPCRALAPILDELSKDLGSKIQVAKMNIDENPETPTKYAVRGIPTMMLFKDGKHIDTKVGMLPKSTLLAWIEAN